MRGQQQTTAGSRNRLQMNRIESECVLGYVELLFKQLLQLHSHDNMLLWKVLSLIVPYRMVNGVFCSTVDNCYYDRETES